MRMASWVADISMLKIATGRPLSTATCSAMLSASAVLPMLGRAGDDDQVARLQARGHLVEVDVAGRHAGDVRRVVAVVEVVDPLEHARQHRLDLEQALVAARARLGDLEDLRLGLVEQLPDLLARPG